MVEIIHTRQYVKQWAGRNPRRRRLGHYARRVSDRKEPTKFDLKRAATRAELLALGAQVFPVTGYVATTVDDVLADSDHSKGAVYFHFGSKEGFFIEVMRYRGQLMGQWWDNLQGRTFSTLLEALEAADPWLDVTSGLPDMLMLAEFRYAMTDKPEMLQQVAHLYEGWIASLEKFVVMLADQGLVRTDLTTRELAETMYHATDGYDVHRAIFGASMDRLRPDLVRLLAP